MCLFAWKITATPVCIKIHDSESQGQEEAVITRETKITQPHLQGKNHLETR